MQEKSVNSYRNRGLTGKLDPPAGLAHHLQPLWILAAHGPRTGVVRGAVRKVGIFGGDHVARLVQAEAVLDVSVNTLKILDVHGRPPRPGLRPLLVPARPPRDMALEPLYLLFYERLARRTVLRRLDGLRKA